MGKIIFRLSTVVLVFTILIVAFTSGYQVNAAMQGISPPSTLDRSLKIFLQKWDNGHDRSARYIAVFQHLTSDKRQQAIVYLIGRGWCGSGGCNTLILMQDEETWRIVTNIRITRPPIRVLDKESHGWHSIAVWVQGGGIQAGYEAELSFNGKTYPINPTVPPAQRLMKELAGKVVISSINGSIPLYD